MAEIGIPAGIAGLVSFTIQVLGISYKYIHGVRNASSSARHFLNELENLKIVLTRIGKMVKDTHQEDIFGDDGSCLLSVKDSNEYLKILQKVQDKLAERQSDSSHRKKLKALVGLTWPFSEKETLDLVEYLHRYLETCNTALAADGRALGILALTEVRDIKASQKQVLAGVEIEAVLDWLSPLSSLNMYQKQQDVFSRRHTGTGSWLLRDPVFERWENSKSSHRTLWCPGDPGAGKTVMTSLVVDYLVKSHASEDTRVAYVYCDYKDQVAQTASNLIACLARQIIGHPDTLPQQLIDLHKELHYEKRRPSLEKLKGLLVALCVDHQQVYLIIDALDECEATKERRSLLPLLETLPHGFTRLFVTSRPNNEDIVRTFGKVPIITISASESDLSQYISEKIDEIEREEIVDRLTAELREDIVSSITARASGMFLLAALQFDRIINARTVRKIKDALSSMPGRLDELYRQTLERIQQQPGDDGADGMRILSWVAQAKRPLSVDELRHGLAVEYDDDDDDDEKDGGPDGIDEENLLSPESLVDVCAGLVIIDSTSQIIRLVHYTTQEYFDKVRLHIFKDAEIDISRACLTYLSYSFGFGTEFESKENAMNALRSHPFLDYACHHWFSHVKSGLLAENPNSIFLKVVARFKRSDSISISTALLRFMDHRWIYRIGVRGWKSKRFPLEVASDLGLEDLTTVLLDHNTGSYPGIDSSLVIASYEGYLNVVKLLLEYGARVDSTPTYAFGGRYTALGAACWKGHPSVAKILIENGANIHGGVPGTILPLHDAVYYDRITVVELLLKEGVNVNARDSMGRTACHLAAAYDRVDVVKLLLDAHCDMELTDDNGWTALHYAAKRGRLEIIELLLDGGADASAKIEDGETARNLLEFLGFGSNAKPVKRRRLQPLIQRMLQLEEASSSSPATADL